MSEMVLRNGKRICGGKRTCGGKRKRSSDDDVPKTTKYYKLLHGNLTHYGFKYKPNALNVDPNPFCAEGQCKKGGLYFFSEDQLFGSSLSFNFVDLNQVKFICEVTIPKDAEIYHEFAKSKASKLILGELRPAWKDDRFCLAVIENQPSVILHKQKQTRDKCFYLAIKHRFPPAIVQYLSV